MFREVDELVKHFIVTCDDESKIFEIKCVMYGEGLGTTITFSCRLGGGEVIAGT